MKPLVFDLLDIAARIEKRFDSALSLARGVSLREYRMLASLSAFEGGRATRVALAEAVGLTPSAVTRALKPLEKVGLVATEKSARDARQSLARLTPAGEVLLSEVEQVVADVAASLPPLPVTEGEMDALARGLAMTSRAA